MGSSSSSLQSLHCPLLCLNLWATIQRPSLKLLSFESQLLTASFLQGTVNRLRWKPGQREECDLYVTCSTGQALGDRDPRDDLFDVLFCHLLIYAGTLEF